MFALGTGNGFITLSNVRYCMPFVRQQAAQSMCADFNLINIWLTKFQKTCADTLSLVGPQCLWLVLELAIAGPKCTTLISHATCLGVVVTITLICCCGSSRTQTCYRTVVRYEERSANVKHCCPGYVEKEEGKCICEYPLTTPICFVTYIWVD